jgi:UDP-N-acetylmuramate--alanine ligase
MAAHFTLIEDYGHHPDGARRPRLKLQRGVPSRGGVWCWRSSHAITCTRDRFVKTFVQVVAIAPMWLWLSEVYAAGESPIPAADGRALARAIGGWPGNEALVFAAGLVAIGSGRWRRSRPGNGDVVMCMGAGSIGQVPAQVLALAPTQS